MMKRSLIGLAALVLLLGGTVEADVTYTITDLGTLGGDYSYATGINDSGQVAGIAKTASGQYRAFLYDSGTMTNLGSLGTDRSLAFGINDSGQVVGYVANTTSPYQQRAFLYDSGNMTDLNDLLPPGSGWDHLEHARDINNNGQIVGEGWIDGQEHAFLLTPVPEPSTLTLLIAALLGGLGIAMRRYRWRKP